MKTNQLNQFLNKFLEIDRFDDYCPNGLQVEANLEIKKIDTTKLAKICKTLTIKTMANES